MSLNLYVVFLTIMVLFLVLVGLVHIVILNRLMLRIRYIEGTTDSILDLVRR